MSTLEKTQLEKETATTTQLSGSQAVLEALLQEGVDTVFGYPGGAIMPIYDALYDYNEKLKHILVRHEQEAYMQHKVMHVLLGKLAWHSRPAAQEQLTWLQDWQML